MTRPNRQLAPHIRRKILNELQSNLGSIGNGLWKFTGIIRDKDIAERYGASPYQVQSLRRSFFGPLDDREINSRGAGPMSIVFQRLDALEEEVKILKDMINPIKE